MKKVNFGDTRPCGGTPAKGAAPHSTANKAPERISTPTAAQDASKPGGTREWPYAMGRNGARNKWFGKKPDPELTTGMGLFELKL